MSHSRNTSWRGLRDVASYVSLFTESALGAAAYISWDRSPTFKFQKRVFFIRHPHTNEAVDRIYRGDSAEITEKGWEEAHMVAGRMADMGGITHIVTSTLPRSIQLAELIATAIGEFQPPPLVIPNELFVEVRKPSVLSEVHRDSELHHRTMMRIYRLFDHNYRHSDEDNRWRLEHRLFDGLRFLEEFEGDNIIVVTHGKFLRMLFHFLYEGGTLLGFYKKADRILKHGNTGVTELVLGPSYRDPETLQWNIESWNDLAHRRILVPISTLRKLSKLP